MIKVSKKDELKLRDILSNLITAQKYILKENVLICRKDNGKPYGTSYVNKEGTGISEMNKHIGIDLCYLYNAINKLSVMLTEEPKTLEIEF